MKLHVYMLVEVPDDVGVGAEILTSAELLQDIQNCGEVVKSAVYYDEHTKVNFLRTLEEV